MFGNDDGISRNHSFVPAKVHAERKTGDGSFAVGLDPAARELRNTGRQAGREASGSHHGDVHVRAFQYIGLVTHGGKRKEWMSIEVVVVLLSVRV
jgi:hypothetical protein